MGLVEYSESDEGSDTESSTTNAPTQPTAPPKPAAKLKTGFQKVVDRSEPGKIRVSLPEVKPEVVEEAEDAIEPPAAKRAKTGGAFSGFSSLLPPPKNANKNKASVSSGGTAARGAGPGRGVNLRTGAAPAFSRQTEPRAIDQTAPTNSRPDAAEENDGSTLPRMTEPQQRADEPKLVGKSLMFKPLSVSRKPQKTKKKPPATPQTPVHSTQSNGESKDDSAVSKLPPPKPKVSLFGSAPEATATTKNVGVTHGYQPLLEVEAEEQDDIRENGASNPENPPIASPHPLHSSTNELDVVADSLNLSASDRRQLFGRKGKPTNAQIAEFSLAEEYQHNNKLRQDESSTPQLNPVKSLAPGKHSLQQLVNAATGQKDALEEAFAQGRKNKRDVGTRYGW